MRDALMLAVDSVVTELVPSTKLLDYGMTGAMVFALIWGATRGATRLIPKALDICQAAVAKGLETYLATNAKMADSNEKMAATHEATVRTLVTEFRDEMRAHREWTTTEFEKRDEVIGRLADAVAGKEQDVVRRPDPSSRSAGWVSDHPPATGLPAVV